MASRAKIVLFLAFCCSAGAHSVAYASLAAARLSPLPRSEVSEVNFELPALPTPTPELPPEPSNPRLDSPRLASASATHTPPARPAARSAATAVAPASNPAPALDLSGVTLTNDSDSGFAMPVGDGSALHGPIGTGAAHVPALTAAAPSVSVAKAPALVDVRDLSERPKPPSLAALLRENYPEAARQRGLPGNASLRARIDADGVIRNARLLSESSAGFGAACRRTVLGSRWSAPRDKNGGAVTTEIVYTCHFEVDR
ncbi:MAG TPA: TonB family protein [Polyangiaceae bacterium]|nr:TonB family protein [Polyangiaceae bacterium]